MHACASSAVRDPGFSMAEIATPARPGKTRRAPAARSTHCPGHIDDQAHPHRRHAGHAAHRCKPGAVPCHGDDRPDCPILDDLAAAGRWRTAKQNDSFSDYLYCQRPKTPKSTHSAQPCACRPKAYPTAPAHTPSPCSPVTCATKSTVRSLLAASPTPLKSSSRSPTCSSARLDSEFRPAEDNKAPGLKIQPVRPSLQAWIPRLSTRRHALIPLQEHGPGRDVLM